MLHERWDTTSLNENREEERKIVENIMKHVKTGKYDTGYYIILNDGRMISVDNYADMLDKGKISSNDAYVFVIIASTNDIVFFLYPFLSDFSVILDIYLFRRGFYYYVVHDYYEEQLNYDIVYYSAPATSSLRFIAVCIQYGEYLAIELINLDMLTKNIKIEDIIDSYSRTDILDGNAYEEILEELESQPLFADYDFDKAEDILSDYYNGDDKTLEKEVAKITNAYNEVFKPYRFCVDKRTWSQIDCSVFGLLNA